MAIGQLIATAQEIQAEREILIVDESTIKREETHERNGIPVRIKKSKVNALIDEQQREGEQNGSVCDISEHDSK